MQNPNEEEGMHYEGGEDSGEDSLVPNDGEDDSDHHDDEVLEEGGDENKDEELRNMDKIKGVVL